jgi:hypothetical protein
VNTEFDGAAATREPSLEPAGTERARGRFAELLWGALILGCLAPLIVRYSPPLQVSWDEAYALGRAICTDRAVFAFDGRELVECFAHVKKSPLLAMIALPFGPLPATSAGLGLTLVSLAVLQWMMAVALVVLLLELRIPRWMAVAVVLALALTKPLTEQAGRLLADMPFTLTVAATLLLVPLEARASRRGGAKEDVVRGVVWGVVFTLGLLGKMTYLVFAGVVGAALIFVRWRLSGARSAGRAVAAAAVVAAPAITLTALCWESLYAHAQLAAFGTYAHLWSSGKGPLGYLAGVAASAPFVTVSCVLLAAALPFAVRRNPRAALASLPGLVAVCLYEVVALTSANQDIRFQFPTLVGLPLALLVPWARLDEARGVVSGRAVLAWAAAGVVLAIPASARYDFSNIVDQARFFERLPTSRKWRVLLATDSPMLGTDTLQAALELIPRGIFRAGIDTVVYDEADGRDLEFSLGKVDLADYMIMDADPSRLYPEWTNTRAQVFREAARTRGRYVPELSTRDFEVYAMRGSR